MSIEKFNPRIYGEAIPYTQVNSKVIQEITNMEAGFVWVYLLTLPPTWKVVKEHLKNHFGIGKEKIKSIFSYLNKCNLIEYVQDRSNDGKMGQSDIRVLNGNKFINYSGSTASPENRPPVKPVAGESPTTKNIINNKDIYIKNKDKDIGQPTVDPKSSDPSLFDDFWKEYPRRVKRKKTKIIWDQKKLYLIFDQIIFNIRQRNATEWKGKDKQYIPHPTTYLNNEQWNDEILETNHDRKENSVERSFRDGIERIKQLQQQSEWDASVVATQDSSTLDRTALPPF